MVSSTLCPAVHILGSQNVYGRAEGIADHYWPWAVFSFYHSYIIHNFPILDKSLYSLGVFQFFFLKTGFF